MAGAQTYEPEADLAELAEHPDNPRAGDDDAVAESIDVNGFYGAIIAQLSTRRILAGHTRRRNLLATGATTGPVLWLDVDDRAARRILLADNRTAELAAWIPGKLADVLAAMGADLEGSGFTEADLAIAVAQAGDAAGQSRDYNPGRVGSVLVIHAPVELVAEFHALDAPDDAARLGWLLARAGWVHANADLIRQAIFDAHDYRAEHDLPEAGREYGPLGDQFGELVP
jgi:ParB-like chromosome segregation protein Spo0J